MGGLNPPKPPRYATENKTIFQNALVPSFSQLPYPDGAIRFEPDHAPRRNSLAPFKQAIYRSGRCQTHQQAPPALDANPIDSTCTAVKAIVLSSLWKTLTLSELTSQAWNEIASPQFSVTSVNVPVLRSAPPASEEKGIWTLQ